MAFAFHGTKLVQILVNCFFMGHFSGAAKLAFEMKPPSISHESFVWKLGTQLACKFLSTSKGVGCLAELVLYKGCIGIAY